MPYRIQMSSKRDDEGEEVSKGSYVLYSTDLILAFF